MGLRPRRPVLRRIGAVADDRPAQRRRPGLPGSRRRRPSIPRTHVHCAAGSEVAAEAGMTDRLIRITTALAVTAVATVAAVISYRHAYELVSTHGESGLTARLMPFTVDGLILAASMLTLDASRRRQPVPALARWCLAAGIIATTGANLAHGLSHGLIGALISAWPALALAGSFELLMTLIRTERRDAAAPARIVPNSHQPEITDHDAPLALTGPPTLDQTVRAWHQAGHSQRAIARELNIDRRKVKRILDRSEAA